MSNPAIAKAQGVSLDAIKFHLSNILPKLGISRRAELRQWAGVRSDSALAAKDIAMTTESSLGAIGQISRTVTDITASKAWYETTLGLKHLYSFGKLSFFDCDGVRLFLTESATAQTDSIIYFRVDDVRLMHQELKVRGVEFVAAPHMIHKHEDGTEEWMAAFKDNEGRPLAIMSQVPA